MLYSCWGNVEESAAKRLFFCFASLTKKSYVSFVPSPQNTGLNKLISWVRFWVPRIACATGWAFLLILETFDVAAEWDPGSILPPCLIQCLFPAISTADLAEIGHLLFSPVSPDSLPLCDS